MRDDIEESIIETAYREVREETGIDLSGVSYKVIKIGEWQAIDKGVPVKILGIFFHFVLPQRPQVALSEEHNDFVWVNLSNYQNYDLHPDLKKSVEIVFNRS
jgi:8-oxo-dGTP pyrophosphatase MutT (NUDIX family)